MLGEVIHLLGKALVLCRALFRIEFGKDFLLCLNLGVDVFGRRRGRVADARDDAGRAEGDGAGEVTDGFH